MKHIKLYEQFIFEKEITSTEIIVSGDSSEPSNWNDVAKWVWAASKSERQWKISFVLPKVAKFEIEKDLKVKITPFTDLKEELFKRGEGTNFDSSIIYLKSVHNLKPNVYDPYKKMQSIPDALSLLVRNCSRAAFADKVKTDLKVDYNLTTSLSPTGIATLPPNLQTFGFTPGEHVFDPGTRADDLLVWIEHAPSVITARGSFSATKPELVKALKELKNFLPNKLTIEAEIQ